MGSALSAVKESLAVIVVKERNQQVDYWVKCPRLRRRFFGETLKCPWRIREDRHRDDRRLGLRSKTGGFGLIRFSWAPASCP